MRLRIYLYSCAIALLLLAFIPDISQALGIVQGVVRNEAGDPVSGALIESRYASAITWRDGSYLVGHPAGTFTVTASASGYGTQAQSVDVIDLQSVNLDFILAEVLSPPTIQTAIPSLGETGTNLDVTLRGTDFDQFTRVSMYIDTVNKSKIIGSVDMPDNAKDITIVGNIAYVADDGFDSGLQIIDISNPTDPGIIQSFITPGFAYGLAVVNDIAYVADYFSLQVIDVSDPEQPVNLGSLTTQGSAYGITVVGDIAYVADYSEGLEIIDVSNPAQPNMLGLIDTPGYAQDVTVIENKAYVADGTSGLQIIDVSNPALPTTIGSVDTPNSAQKLSVNGNIAYVADGPGGLQVIDVSDPVHPGIIGSVDTPDSALDVTILGDIAYLAGSTRGLQIIDVINPALPRIIGSVDTTGIAYGVAGSGSLAYVADGSSGLQVIDSSNPSLPYVIGSVEAMTNALGLHVAGNNAYVADGSGGLQVIDTSNPVQPTIIGTVDTTEFIKDITISDNIAYTVGGTGLQVIDVGDPANPFIIGSVDTLCGPSKVTVVEQMAYVADDTCGLQVIDVNPNNTGTTYLTIIGSVDTPGVAYDVTVSGDMAYVADGFSSGLVVIDLTKLNTLEDPVIGSVVTPGMAFGVTVIGSIAYVADRNNGLQVIDISDPFQPEIIGNADTPEFAYEITAIGDRAYIADGHSGLQMIDVSDPANPVIIGAVDTLGEARDVSIVGDRAYIADVTQFVIVPLPVEVTDYTVISDTEITASLPGPQFAGNYILRAFNNIRHDELPGAVTFTDNADLLHARAIIVAGGGPAATGDIWEETKSYAREAYNSLIYQGYKPENIYYLTDEAAAEGRDAGASPQNLQYAITDWANDDPDTKSLVLYLVDHGEDERFQIRGNANPELAKYVTAAELDSWLDTLQAGSSLKVLLVYDACHSGSFVDTLRESDDTRVVITSVAEAEVAYFLDLKQSFSGIFWGTLSGKTGTQGNLYNAWTLASRNMADYQSAQLDANGNGVTNEPEDVDAIEQNIFEIGRQWFNADFSRPVVNAVAADQVLNGDTSAPLSAWGIYDVDNNEIYRVWAEIIAPDYVPVSGITITSLPSVDLADPDADNMYTAVFPDDTGGAYTGFDTQGTYIINYYAEDSSGVYSEPKTALVTQQGFSPVLIPDQYEDDDTAGQAQVIVVNSPTPQEHSFHDTGDQDWVVFYGLAGEVYSVRAMNPTIISDPVISIYSGSNLNNLIISSNTAGMGTEEQLKNWTCPADGLYYVRITNNSGHYGANVRYKLKVYSPIAFSLPGYVKGKITSGGNGVAGAVILAGGGTAITLADGSFILCLESGSYSASVSCEGYQAISFSVNVGSGQSVSLSKDMNSVPRILNFPATRIKANEEYSYVPLVSDVDGDPLTFFITGAPSWANFSTANGRLWGRPGAADKGIYGPITIKVSDNAGASDSVTFTLKVEQETAGSLPGILMLLHEQQ